MGPTECRSQVYLKELADFRRTYPDLRQGNLRWKAFGTDGLVAEADSLEV